VVGIFRVAPSEVDITKHLEHLVKTWPKAGSLFTMKILPWRKESSRVHSTFEGRAYKARILENLSQLTGLVTELFAVVARMVPNQVTRTKI
jgi:hypothetical protein